MKLYNFKFIQTLYSKTLCITVDLDQFNNVDIHINCEDSIKYFMSLVNSNKFNTIPYQDKMSKFCEENYCNEIDPHSRGEN